MSEPFKRIGEVKVLVSTGSLEIKDLYDSVVKEEVVAALVRVLDKLDLDGP